MKTSFLACFVLAFSASGATYAQADRVTVKRDAAVRIAPSPTASNLVTLASNTAVLRLAGRQGPWVQVTTEAGITGWVHIFDVGGVAAQSAAASTATGALRGLGSFFNRGSAQAGTTNATATVGIRGLGAEDIASARPNPAALAQAQGLHLDASEARRFAADARLVAHAVEPLPVPPAPNGARP